RAAGRIRLETACYVALAFLEVSAHGRSEGDETRLIRQPAYRSWSLCREWLARWSARRARPATDAAAMRRSRRESRAPPRPKPQVVNESLQVGSARSWSSVLPSSCPLSKKTRVWSACSRLIDSVSSGALP